MKPVEILDVPVHPATYDTVVSRVDDWVRSRRRPAATIVQTNALTLVTAQEDISYRALLQDADLSLPDGMPVVWLLRWKGIRIPGRVYGPDLMKVLAERGASRTWRFFLYGGGPRVPEEAARTLRQWFPGIDIVGEYSPPFRPLTRAEDLQVCAMINAARPDILWVSLGGERQDRWIADHRDSLEVSVMHGVGAAFDFLAGRVPQAPTWIRNAGFEWLFRLAVEPRRLWRRYTIKNLKFCYFVLTRVLLGRSIEKETQ